MKCGTNVGHDWRFGILRRLGFTFSLCPSQSPSPDTFCWSHNKGTVWVEEPEANRKDIFKSLLGAASGEEPCSKAIWCDLEFFIPVWSKHCRNHSSFPTFPGFHTYGYGSLILCDQLIKEWPDIWVGDQGWSWCASCNASSCKMRCRARVLGDEDHRSYLQQFGFGIMQQSSEVSRLKLWDCWETLLWGALAVSKYLLTPYHW